MKKTWYQIQNKYDSAEIEIHDEIGSWGISASSFASDLKALGDVKSINVSIHSPGGSAFDGIAIHNMLTAHKAPVNTSVLGVAASAASIILMAGDTITMPEDSFLMIHEPFTMAMGNAEELRETADLLDKMTTSLVNIYEKKTGLDEEEIRSMLAEETWLNGIEAVDKGFATEAVNRKVAALSKDFIKHFKNAPYKDERNTDFADFKEFKAYLCKLGASNSEAERVLHSVKDLQSKSAVQSLDLTQLSSLLNKGIKS